MIMALIEPRIVPIKMTLRNGAALMPKRFKLASSAMRITLAISFKGMA